MIKESVSNFGDKVYSLQMGKVKGRNWLLSKGFTQCQNPNYYQHNEVYASYNRILKYWIIDGKQENLVKLF